MNERNLRNLALLVSIIGLIILYYAALNIQADEIDISKITIDDLGSTARVCGEITSKRVSNNHVFFDLKDETGTIDIIIFNTTAAGLKNNNIDVYSFEIGDTICLIGVVDEYPKGSGQLELVYSVGEIEKL